MIIFYLPVPLFLHLFFLHSKSLQQLRKDGSWKGTGTGNGNDIHFSPTFLHCSKIIFDFSINRGLIQHSFQDSFLSRLTQLYRVFQFSSDLWLKYREHYLLIIIYLPVGIFLHSPIRLGNGKSSVVLPLEATAFELGFGLHLKPLQQFPFESIRRGIPKSIEVHCSPTFLHCSKIRFINIYIY